MIMFVRSVVPLFSALLAICLFSGCAKDPFAGMSPTQRVVAESMVPLGGQIAEDQAAILRFDFVEKIGGRESSRRIHDWDRNRGSARVRWRDTESGVTYDVNFNTKRKTSYDQWTALKEGGRVIRDKEELNEVCGKADKYFIHDMHWIFAPYRLNSKKANITKVAREVDPRGSLSQAVTVSYPEGTTPYSEYKVFIDPALHKWEAWTITADESIKLSYTWEGWKKSGPLMVSTLHKQIGGDHTISIEKLNVELIPTN
jgi:hypothetical protein